MFVSANGLRVAPEAGGVYSILSDGPGVILARYSAIEQSSTGMPSLWTPALQPVDPASADGAACVAALSEYLHYRAGVARLAAETDPWDA